MKLVWRTMLILVAAMTLGACGYQSHELYPEQYRSVSSRIFENLTFYQGVEFELAEAITKELESRTPYKVTPEGLADTQLSGVIREIDQDQTIRRRIGDVPSEMEVQVTVDFTWQDLRTGRVIVDRRGFTATGRYLPARSAGEPLQVGIANAVQQIAQQIVSTLRADWQLDPDPDADAATTD